MADEKKTKSVETSKSNAKKNDKKANAPEKKGNVFQRMGNFFKRLGHRIAKFFKDVKGECKKIVWPDRKTVLKSTWVVIVIVVIFCVVLWLVDTGLSACVKGLINLAGKVGSKEAATAAGMMVSGLFGF